MASEEEWKFLSKIYPMLIEENVICVNESEPVVRFEYPDKLLELFDFTIDSELSIPETEIEEICKKVLRYSVKTGHPHFHNQLFAGTDPYGLAGSWITDALNTSQYTYEVGPIFTMVENFVIKKCLKLFGYENGDGIFSPGGSISNFYGMVLARYKTFPNIKATGLFGLPKLVVFTSEDSHYSMKKSVHWLGIGTDNLVVVKTDAFGRMIAEDLDIQIQKTITAGSKPFFVNATAGTTVLGAFDNFNDVADICKKYGIWMHVDACLGGTAILSQTHKHLLAGIERSDSIAWNPHKSLGAPLQCSIFIIKENGLLHNCNSANAQYLFQQDKFYDISYDTGDKSVQCGRKVDAFKIWLIFKCRGSRRLEELVDNSFRCAEYLTERIKSLEGFRLVLDEFQYTNICFWYIPKSMRSLEETADWWTKIYEIPVRLKKKMMESGCMMVGYTPLSHKGIGNFFRMVVTCFPHASEKSMDYILKKIEEMAEQI